MGSEKVTTILDLATAQSFAVALLIGALIGIEREKRKGEAGSIAFGGIRTFVLLAQIGAVSAWLSLTLQTPWVFIAATLSVSLLVLGSYLTQTRAEPESVGLTSEIAAICTHLLGGMTILGHMELAVGLAVITAALLAYKQPLHGLIDEMGWDDIFAGLRLLIASFIVLPLLPNRTIDSLNALNPYKLWLLVILISGLSLVGYTLARWLGPRRGMALTALTGGLVSSTAVTLSFSKDAARVSEREKELALASGILLAWGVMFWRVLVEVLIVNRAFVSHVIAPLAVMGVTATLAATFLYRKCKHTNGKSTARVHEMKLNNPFSLTEAGKFAALFAAILVLVRVVEAHAPPEGMYAVAAIAGLTDVDAITLAMAEHAASGNERAAAIAIVLAVISNTLVKFCFVAAYAAVPVRSLVLKVTLLTLVFGIAACFLSVFR